MEALAAAGFRLHLIALSMDTGSGGREQAEAGGCSPTGPKGCGEQRRVVNGDHLEQTSDGRLLPSERSVCLLVSFGAG